MNTAFLFLVWLLRINGDGQEGTCSNEEMIRQMQSDPEFLLMEKSFREHLWRTACRADATAIVGVLVHAARYLSDVIGGDVPLLVPRDVVEASAGVSRPGQADALLIGRAMQRAIRNQLSDQTSQMTESLISELQRLVGALVAGHPTQAVPAESKYLDTKAMAARLGLSEITVARLCARGEIQADKTRGNQWRTTEARLRHSPYLNGQKRRGRARAALEQ
jgi:hypothetical protein